MAGGVRQYALSILVAIVVLRLLAHAFLVPVFEGPDEPFHLARALHFARGDFATAWRGTQLPADLARAISAYPCAADLRAEFGCPAFLDSAEGAWGNILRDAPGPTASIPDTLLAYPNYEAHQPPLGYAALGAAMAPWDALLKSARTGNRIGLDLLAMRLLCVACVVGALLGPLRILATDWSRSAKFLGLSILLLPGASESLARGALEAPLMLWSSCALLISSRKPASRWLAAVVLAAGPLVKLTALPVVAFGLGRIWKRSRCDALLATFVVAASFASIQASRGWLLGGAVEFHAQQASPAPVELGEAVSGLIRAAAVAVKTAFWLGGWSGLRPPTWVLTVLLAWVAFVLISVRPRRPWRWDVATVTSLATAAAGFAAFAWLHHRLFGVWAGVGGWYFWGWAPWLAWLGAAKLTRRPPEVVLPMATLIVAIAVSAEWFALALEAYGG